MADFTINDDGSFEYSTQSRTRTRTRKKQKEEKWYDEYFKESQGNGWQTFGYSALDALGNLTEGSLRAFEGISDWGRNRGADIVDFFGADEYAKELRERSKEDDTADIVKQWNHITAGDISGTKSEEEIGHFKKVEENSIFGDKSDQVFQGVGNSLTSIGVGALSGGTLSTPSFVLSAAGSAETEALNDGATAGEARMYGLISGAIEYGTERLFGGLGKTSEKFGLGKGALDDQAVKLFTKNMKSSLMKNITTLGIKSVGEGLEEVASGIGNAFAQKITYMDEEEIGQLLKDQNLMDSFVNGMLSSALMQGPSTITSTVQGRDVNTGLTRTQQQYVNEIAQQRMVEAQRRNAKLNGYEKGKIEDRALTDFQKGRLANASQLQQVNLPGLSNKDMDLQQSAYKYGINPNSEAITTAKAMLDNKGIKSRFDADEFKDSGENSKWVKKGGVREVIFNPNASADVLLEEIAIHELTHDLMSSENSNEALQHKDIISYVSKLKDYEEKRTKLEELYSSIKDENGELIYNPNSAKFKELIDEEVLANTLGKNIGSQEYVRRLIDDEPSIAKNIYDWVVNKVANKNGVKNEKAYWNNVKNNFEKAYNMEYQGKGSKKSNNQAKYKIVNDKKYGRHWVVETEKDIFKGKTKKELPKSAFDYILNGNTNFETITDTLDGKKVKFIRISAKEYTRGRNSQNLNPNEYQQKMRLAPSVDDLINNAEIQYHSPLTHKNNMFKDGFNNYQGKVKIDDTYFRYIVRVGKAKNDNIFYDISLENLDTKKEANAVPGAKSTSPLKNLASRETNVTQSNDNVKSDQKYSLSEKTIQGLERYSTDDIKQLTKEYIQEKLYENDLYDVAINGIAIHGSRARGTARTGSDLDIVVEYEGNVREDTLFDILNEEPMYFNDIRVDINPITASKTGTLAEYMESSDAYDQEILAKQTNYSLSEQLEKQANEVAKKEIAERQAMIELFEDYLSENDITNPTEQDIYNSLDAYDVYDANESFDQEGQEKYFDTIKKYLKEQNQDIRYSLSDYQEYKNEINATLEKAKNLDEKFYNDLIAQQEEYRERHQLEYNILEETDSRPATNKNINSDFFKEHRSEYDENRGIKTADGIVTVMHLQKGDNLAKLSFTEGEDKIWIDELYVKNQKQGYGSEIVNAIKKYAEENGKYVQAFKELSTAKGFWDKTLRNNTRYSLTDNKGKELTKEQQEHFKDSKARDEQGKLLELYHGTPNDNFTIFENQNIGTGAGLMGLKQKGFYFTDRYESAESYSAVKGINENNGVKKVYLNMTNPLVVDTTTESGKQAIRDMFGLRKNAKVTYNFINKYINKMLYDDAINIRSEEQRQEFFNSTGYDGVILKTDLGTDNEYIVFNSNQIKAVDNLNPTDDADIRYSLSDTGLKQKQLDIILKNNPVEDDYHTWIRSVDDIKTYEEALQEDLDGETQDLSPDFKKADLEKALETGKMTVYSSYPIEQGIFVTPSKMEAQSYAGSGKVYSKEIDLDDVAWIDTLQGQYAKVQSSDIRYSLSDNQEERILKLQKEYDALDKTRDVTFDERDALRKELNELIRSENYKNANSKFMEMVRSGLSPNEISKTPEYQLMAEEERIRKKLKEYDEDIKVMTEDMTRITEMIENEEQSHRNPEDAIKQAKDFFGTTNDFREAGYLLQDGTLLDFSGRTQGSRTYGRRTLDHREINEVGYDMDEFIELGNIRMKPESSGFELSKPLTKEQKSIIRDYLDTLDDDIMIDITKEGKVLYDSATYKKGTSSSKIFNDLDYYFENGSFPKQSKYAEFRYSLSKQNEDWQSFLDNNFESKGTKTRLSDIKLPGITNTVQEEVQTEVQKSLLPIANELKELNKNLNKVLNPNEISQLTPQDASTTPNLPGVNRNKVGDGKSKFFDNIKDKTNMLNDEQKTAILNSEDVKYYDKVTNKDSLDKAFERLQNGGANEALRWFNNEAITPTDVAEGWILLKQYGESGNADGMVEVAKKMRQMGSVGGQVIQAFNIMSRLTPEGMVKYAQSELLEAYDQMVKNKSAKWIEENRSKFDLQPNEVKFIMDTMQEVSTMEDGYDKKFKLAQIQKLMTDKLPPSKGAGIKAWMRISMLFNPKTQVRNVAGNALIAPINAFGDMFASGVDKLVSAKTGVRTTGNTNWKNYAQGMKTGLYQSYNDFKNGVNTRNIEGNRFEVTEGKSFNDNNAIGKALNKVDSLLSFMLDAGDRGFYEASFVNSINNQMVLNNTTEVTQDMIDIATQEALSRTWQDNNEYTKFVMNVRNGLNKLNIGGYGLGDVLIPFAKTPANLTKAIVEYSPVGLIGTINKGIKLNRSLTNGQYSAKTQHEFVQSLGKATAGTMLYILGIALANAGVTTGESDEDKDVSNFMKNTLGVNSYSIKIGDMSFTYDWAQPLAAPLAITANLVQKQKEEASLLENVVSTLDTAGNLLLEQSFMESISTVLNNNEGIATGMQEAILDLPARAIPTFLKQITDLTDGTQRQTFVKDKPIESMFNSIKAKIPGLSYTLDPSVDTLGREIQKYGGKNNLFNVFLNPANVSTENVSESAQEIYRLYKETGETNIMPRVAPYYVNKKGEKIILTTQQRTQYQKVSGAIIEENIANLLGSTAYQNMSDTKKAETINDIVNYSYNIAQNQVLGTELSDTYETAYEYAQIGDISDFYEFRNSIDDTNADTKRTSIVDYLYNSDLEDNQIANLYGNYYSSDKTLNAMLELRIPMREFIKFNSADIQGQYNSKTGQTISGSKKNATIEFVNTLNLSKAQRAILVKSVYSSYKNNDNDIVRYVNTLPGTANEKKVWLKSIGFDAYDDDVFNYINSQNISKEEKIKKLKELGFTVRDGRVYY